MTSKQKLELVAAQYVAKARAMTCEGDKIAKIAGLIAEEEAKELLKALSQSGLIDDEGLLTEGGRADARETALSKVGLS